MTLDERARQAAAGVKESVGSADLLLFEAGVPGLRRNERPTFRRRAFAFGGAFALVVAVVGLALLPGRLFSPDDTNVAGDPGVTAPSTVDGDAPDGGVATSPTSTPVATVAPDGSTTLPAIGAAPSIRITAPVDGEEFTVEAALFQGTVDPGARVYARAGELIEVPVDEAGNWQIELFLQAPATTARFFAESADGVRSDDVSVTVLYTPPSPDVTVAPDPPEVEPPEGTTPGGPQPSEEDPSAVAFSAVAELTDDGRGIRFTGTGQAGHRVRIVSDFGQAGARADALGRWAALLTLEDVPPDVTIEVTVMDVDSGEFEVFSYTAPPEG